MKGKNLHCDVLVVGGGMSGIFAALKAKEQGADVLLTDKNYVGRSGATIWSSMFTAFSPAWGHDLKEWMGFLDDAFEGMNHAQWTRILLEESYERYMELESWGVEFPVDSEGKHLGFHAPGVPVEARVMTKGVHFLPKLRNKVLQEGIRIIDHVMITELLMQDGVVRGAAGFHSHTGEPYRFDAGAVILCTGPLGFKSVKNMAVANLTGDGEAMAYRCGAQISGKEFAFAGSTVYQGAKNESERAEMKGRQVHKTIERNMVWGGYLPQLGAYDFFVDAKGYPLNRFTAAAAIHEGRGPVYLDMDKVPEPMVQWSSHELKESGEQYRMERIGLKEMRDGLWMGVLRTELNTGGLHGGGSGIAQVDLNCATNVPGLYAAGDAYNSRTGGARYQFVGFGQCNAAVTGARAGVAAAKYASDAKRSELDASYAEDIQQAMLEPLNTGSGFSVHWTIQQIQNLVFPYYYSIVKQEDRLKAALTTIGFLKDHVCQRLYAEDVHSLRLVHETRNLALNAEMLIRASLFRTESRGNHYREDYPQRNDADWRCWVRLKNENGRMEAIKEPIPEDAATRPLEHYFMNFPDYRTQSR